MRLTNSLTGKKELFQTQDNKSVTLYVCGITPYSPSHLGHARAYVSFDVLNRLLRFLGYDVLYVRNFTDIDDKLLNRAQQMFGDPLRYPEIANQVIDLYHQEMKALNCASPQVEPRVTEHIPQIIKLIEALIKQGAAYQSGGDVYFRISSFPEYGKLSKQKSEELRAGVRIEVGEKKEDPLDFALWKSEAEGTFWHSPWGWGRPGWHIECSALAKEYLGDTIDIHAGGLDLIFPHHENEVAQSEAANRKPFARYWLHNGLVNIEKQKMSKSFGNMLSLQDLFTDYEPQLLRYYLLNHHYRAPLDFSFEELQASKKSYQKLVRLFERCAPSTASVEEMKKHPVIKNMLAFLEDDINTVGMFGVLFEQYDLLAHDPVQCGMAKTILQEVLGLTLAPLTEKAVLITPEIQKLVDAREAARACKDWATADRLRDELVAMGVEVKDKRL